MRYHEFIAESRGIAARDPGEVFYKSDIDHITFQGVIFFPENEKSYETHEELLQALAGWQSDFEGTVEMYGAKNSGTRAAMISIWTSATGKPVAYGKYMKYKSGGYGTLWSNTDFAKATGYETRSSRTVTQQLPIKPSQIVPAEKIETSKAVDILRKNLANADVPDHVKSQMIEMITNAIAGDKTPIAGAAEYANLHEVYTAEYAAPLVYIYGSPLLSGDLAVVDNMLADVGVSRSEFSRVMWPDNPTEKLIDSYIYTDKYRLGISSKSKTGGGASASLEGVMNIITRNRGKMPVAFLKKWETLLAVLTMIMKNSSIDGILKAAKRFRIINLAQEKEIRDRLDSFDLDLSTLSEENRNIIKKSNYGADTTHTNYNIGSHLMAIIARDIAKRLKKMGLDPFFKGVLAYADMIQIYSKVAKRGDGAYFDQFIVKYPPEFDGTIEVGADYYYGSKRPHGKLTFKLKPAKK